MPSDVRAGHPRQRPNAWVVLGVAVALGACSGQHDLDVGEDIPVALDDLGAGEPDAQVQTDSAVSDAGLTPGACVAPFSECDGDPVTRCETDTRSDSLNCGGCGQACDFPGCACIDGARVLQCPAGAGDCDGIQANGCETDLTTSVLHCGGCGVACPTTGREVVGGACEAGACVLQCEPSGHADCDGDPVNGCEVQLLFDSANCGACGVVCPCAAGVCM